jgi:hypothetical protein
MLKRCLTLFGLIAALALLASCGGRKSPAHQDTLLDRNWGRSYESAKYNQILNPEAGKHPEPIIGMDGQAAEGTTEKYRKGFKEEPSSKTYNLNLGSIDSIGQK